MPEERKGPEERKVTEKRNSRLDRSPNREPIPVADLRAMSNAEIEDKMKDIKTSLVRDHSELEDVMQEGNEDLLDVTSHIFSLSCGCFLTLFLVFPLIRIFLSSTRCSCCGRNARRSRTRRGSPLTRD